MPEERNYYDILGLSRTASADDIKKAYRKLVRQYHPDVSTDPDADQKTSELNQAYNVLKDADKRAEYDAMLDNPFAHGHSAGGAGYESAGFGGFGQGSPFGAEHFGQSGVFGSGDFRFDDIFSAFGARGAQGFRQPETGPVRGEDQHAELSIDIGAAYHGASRSLSLDMPTLNEHGRMSYTRKTLNVTIPKGIMEGQQIRLAGQGLPGFNGGANGDLYLKIKFKAENGLSVADRKDVYQRIDVAPWSAVLGEKTQVNTPDGSLTVTLPPNSRNGQKIRLKGRGIPAKEPGDFYLVLNIALPQANSQEERQAWQQLADIYARSKGETRERQ